MVGSSNLGVVIDVCGDCPVKLLPLMKENVWCLICLSICYLLNLVLETNKVHINRAEITSKKAVVVVVVVVSLLIMCQTHKHIQSHIKHPNEIKDLIEKYRIRNYGIVIVTRKLFK